MVVSFFLLDLPKIDVSSLPLYLQSVINAWQALSLRRETSSFATSMFLNESIFHNPLFAAIPSSRTFAQHFVGSDFLSVHNLLVFQRERWKSGCEISALSTFRSIQIIGQIFLAILRALYNLGGEFKSLFESGGLLNQYAFPVLLLSYNGKSVPFNSSCNGKSVAFNSIEKEISHDFCVHFIFADLVKGPFGVQWKVFRRLTMEISASDSSL